MNTQYPELSNTFYYDAYWFDFGLREIMPRLSLYYYQLTPVRDQSGRFAYPFYEYTAEGNNYCAWGELDKHPAEY